MFLLYNSEHARFVHTGIVAGILECGESPAGRPWYDCLTIEGNTNDDGGPEGWGVLRRLRRFHPDVGDRFIRWADAGQQQAVRAA